MNLILIEYLVEFFIESFYDAAHHVTSFYVPTNDRFSYNFGQKSYKGQGQS